MNDNKCPCEECICVPICRHKDYRPLFGQCELLKAYEPEHVNFNRSVERTMSIEKNLRPTKWIYRRGKRHLRSDPELMIYQVSYTENGELIYKLGWKL